MTDEAAALAAAQDEPQVLATRPKHALLRPVVGAAELIEVQKETHQLIAQALEEDRDYGTIPGTNKPTMLKPGAERINLAFGVRGVYTVEEQEVDHHVEVSWIKRTWKWGQERGQKVWTEESGVSLGLYRYRVKCKLIQRSNGEEVGEGVGSCSTLESKYIDRPRELENTVLKMAKKRAFVDATLTAYALSDRFTQDVEDQGQVEVTGTGRKPAAKTNGRKATQKQKDYLGSLAENKLLPDGWAKRLLEMVGDPNLTAADASKGIEMAKDKIEAEEKKKEEQGLKDNPPPSEGTDDVDWPDDPPPVEDDPPY